MYNFAEAYTIRNRISLVKMEVPLKLYYFENELRAVIQFLLAKKKKNGPEMYAVITRVLREYHEIIHDMDCTIHSRGIILRNGRYFKVSNTII